MRSHNTMQSCTIHHKKEPEKVFDSTFKRLPPLKWCHFVCSMKLKKFDQFLCVLLTDIQDIRCVRMLISRILKRTNLLLSAVKVITFFGRVSVFIQKNYVCICAVCTVWRYGFIFAVCQTLRLVEFRMTSLVWCCETLRSYKTYS